MAMKVNLAFRFNIERSQCLSTYMCLNCSKFSSNALCCTSLSETPLRLLKNGSGTDHGFPTMSFPLPIQESQS